MRVECVRRATAGRWWRRRMRRAHFVDGRALNYSSGERRCEWRESKYLPAAAFTYLSGGVTRFHRSREDRPLPPCVSE